MGKGSSDAEEAAIKAALDILITSDGKGRVRKALALSELCCTMNPNKLRDYIKQELDANNFV